MANSCATESDWRLNAAATVDVTDCDVTADDDIVVPVLQHVNITETAKLNAHHTYLYSRRYRKHFYQND